MNAYEIPNLRFSLPAGGAVARCRFVSVNAEGKGVQATAATEVIGASMNLTTAEEIQARVLKLEHRILPKAVGLFADDRIQVVGERGIIK